VLPQVVEHQRLELADLVVEEQDVVVRQRAEISPSSF
jgi:hypothetical protein